MPALLAAQEISSAADFKVEGRNPEARPEVAEFANRRQTLPGYRRQRLFGRNQQVRIGPPVRSPHSSSQLIQLRQAIPIGAVNHDGVRVPDIEAVFDDGGGDEDVVLVGDKVDHDLFQLAVAHLAVANTNPNVRH